MSRQLHLDGVRVTIVEARNLPGGDWLSKSDPYVQITAGATVVKSAVAKSGKVFDFKNQVLDVDLAQGTIHHLEVAIYDHDRFSSDDLISVATVPIDLLKRGAIDQWFELKDAKGQPAGELRLAICNMKSMSAGKAPVRT
ncbi:hypothetical protein GGF32_008909 [Allomyces javanicus]|nr:hypothetical protein GGF32_008909 [Allomyces javanicus]